MTPRITYNLIGRTVIVVMCKEVTEYVEESVQYANHCIEDLQEFLQFLGEFKEIVFEYVDSICWVGLDKWCGVASNDGRTCKNRIDSGVTQHSTGLHGRVAFARFSSPRT